MPATLTYSPLIPQNTADIIRADTCDTRRFSFSAKEKDPETALSYFGSRYYSSDLSIWLSVDPMAAKYPHQSNYFYCSNNPIRVVDPIRMKQSHPAYYSLVHMLDDSGISKPSGNPHGTDHKGDYGHERLCTEPENSPNAIFILRHRGHERTY